MNLIRRTQIGIFCLLLFSTAYFYQPVENENAFSRFCLVSSVVDFGSLDINHYRSYTVDTAVYGGNTYTSKAIGAPYLAIPVYWFLRHCTPLRHDGALSVRTRIICVLLTTCVPYAISGVVLFSLLLAMGAPTRNAFLCVVGYAFGTIAWNYGSSLSGHQIAASCALMSFAILYFHSKNRSADESSLPWLGAGILTYLAGLADYTALYLAGLLTLYAMAKARNYRQRIAFVVGAILMLLMLASYNSQCFGSPWAMSYNNLDSLQFKEGSKHGFFGISIPRLDVFLKLLMSPARGAFFIMPILLLSLPGFQNMLDIVRRRNRQMPSLGLLECVFIMTAVIGYFSINAGYFVWHGGWTFGPRHLVAMLPFLAIPMAFGIDRKWFLPLFALSFLQVALAQIAISYPPEAIANPIVECMIPLFRYGYMPENLGMMCNLQGAMSLLPFFLILILGIWFFCPKDEICESPLPSAKRFWRPIYVCIGLIIVASLTYVRSPDFRAVHELNALLLRNGAFCLDNESLAQAAREEMNLAGNQQK